MNILNNSNKGWLGWGGGVGAWQQMKLLPFIKSSKEDIYRVDFRTVLSEVEMKTEPTIQSALSHISFTDVSAKFSYSWRASDALEYDVNSIKKNKKKTLWVD